MTRIERTDSAQENRKAPQPSERTGKTQRGNITQKFRKLYFSNHLIYAIIYIIIMADYRRGEEKDANTRKTENDPTGRGNDAKTRRETREATEISLTGIRARSVKTAEKRKPGAGGESPMTEQFGYSELRKRSPKRGSRGRNT